MAEMRKRALFSVRTRNSKEVVEGHLRSKDGNSEACRVQAACTSQRDSVGNLVTLTIATKTLLGVGWSASKGGIHTTAALLGAVAGENSHGNKAAHEKKVEHNA